MSTHFAKAPQVLVAHPSRQHSHQMALGLFRGGLLSYYATGIPVSELQIPKGVRPFVSRLSKYESVDLPLYKVKLNMISPVLNKVLSNLLSDREHGYVRRLAEIAFDKWAARIVKEVRPDVVVAYENTALQTFRAAKNLGIKCVLDAASLHHVEQDRHYRTKLNEGLKTRIDAAKDEELDLADLVITASALAAESYRKNVPNKEVVAAVLGVDTKTFCIGDRSRWRERRRPFVFAFVGNATKKKGFGELLSAMKVLKEARLNVELWVAGHADIKDHDGTAYKAFGMLTHHQLSQMLRQAHCLVLPSHFDSFGLVVLEALASGVPAIVSEMVGAKEAIIEGENGFIVPVADFLALSQRMIKLAEDPIVAARMGDAARRTAEKYDWQVYHHNVQKLMQRVMGAVVM